MGSTPPLHSHTQHGDPTTATVELDTDTRDGSPVRPYLYGKFSEHLAWNIYHGMEAQILYNPTFGKWPFQGETTPDGGFYWVDDDETVSAQIAEHAAQREYPEGAADRLETAHWDALSFWWVRYGVGEGGETGDARIASGPGDGVGFSADAGPAEDRAQRIEIGDVDGRAGVLQWHYLPLQRTRGYELTARLRARRGSMATARLALHAVDEAGEPTDELDATDIELDGEWTTHEADLDVTADADLDPDDLVAFTITATEPCNLVVDRVLLYPDDHMNRADPDVIEHLRTAELPLLRWPGGNFVSDYDWRDGVGPVGERPTKPNPAWGGLEPNLFGMHEFVQFCEEVGCDPLLCVNAGNGTPAEAAAWVEYCNGDPEETEMGALRADHGHPEPFDVDLWEIGNELYGTWQTSWTTPDGYVDRYRAFREAMMEADPEITVLGNGHRGEWNDHVVSELGDELRSLTDHILAGEPLADGVDADDVFHSLMGRPSQAAADFRALREQMLDAGIEDPHFAITELQLTPTLQRYADEAVLTPPWRGSRHHPPESELPGKKTVAEALFDASVIHESIRMEGHFAELITHTGTVNHGGGLQKRKERVWPDPCHYGHAMGTSLMGKTPVAVDLECGTFGSDLHVGCDPFDDERIVDAMAAVADDESELVVMLVHRGSGTGDVETTVDLGAFDAAGEAQVTTLTAETMHDENTVEDSDNVTPTSSTVAVDDGTVELTLPEYGLVRLTVQRA